MHKLTVPLWATAITSLSVSRTVFAQNSKVVPCYSGAGNSSTCDICDESKAIQVAAWDNATWVKNFTLPQSPADSGNGYKVHWVSHFLLGARGRANAQTFCRRLDSQRRVVESCFWTPLTRIKAALMRDSREESGFR